MRIQKRRKQAKTDYLRRMKLLKGGDSRIVFRKTNRYVISQFIVSEEAKDKIKIGLTSLELEKYGWSKNLKGSLKSLPAVYLTGLLFGKIVQKEIKNLKNFSVDSGMIRKIHKNRFFAFLKGIKDSGMQITCEDKFFPDEERIKGKHLKEDFSSMFEKIKQNIESKFGK
ncbi:50S ribosomal protein L18 [Patescibacteria group bacterium]|nr:50S ribosomal protein L18 [Patescibacteria group bacterium]